MKKAILHTLVFFSSFSHLLGDVLDLLPKADKQGIVLSTKVLLSKGAQFPYNGSIIHKKNRDGYWLFFRENLMGLTPESFGGARIGVFSLNKEFVQVGDPFFPPYPFFGKSVEDPRAFWLGDSLYLLYYIYPRPAPSTPCLVKIHSQTLLPISVRMLSHKSIPEKNWVPLVSNKESDTLRMIRNLFPTDLVEVDLQDGTPMFSDDWKDIPRKAPSHWKWGDLSGGTQAELVGNRYLSFFHSWFLGENGKRIYVMGACTFDVNPPFPLKEMSPYPILCKELYTAKPLGFVGNPYGTKWAENLEKVIFPCGFVTDTLPSGREVFHVSCGENDNSLRIMTLDKAALLKSLVTVKK